MGLSPVAVAWGISYCQNTGYRILICVKQGSDHIHGCKDCLNRLIPDPTMVGGEERLWFLDALKCSISELILSEKTWKMIKRFSLKFELLHLFHNFWIWARRPRHPIAFCAMKICLNDALAYYSPTLSPTIPL